MECSSGPEPRRSWDRTRSSWFILLQYRVASCDSLSIIPHIDDCAPAGWYYYWLKASKGMDISTTNDLLIVLEKARELAALDE